MRVRLLLTFVLLCALGVCPARGGLLNQHVKVSLHIALHEDRSCSKNMPVLDSRDDLVNYWLQVEYPRDFDVFVVYHGFDQTAGVSFALDWPVEWGSTWYTFICADHNLGNITEPGDWVSTAWIECQPGDDGGAFLPAAWAWLTATGPGELALLPYFQDRIDIVACSENNWAETQVESVFHAGIGLMPYSGPPMVANEPTTWGAIKAMFR